MRSNFLSLPLVLALVGCGSSESPPTPRQANAPLPSPEVGESRPGVAYRVAIPAADPSFDIVFQVLEPRTLVGGESYPLIMHSHGFGNARTSSYEPTGEVGNLALFTENGYGAISIDMRGHGETGGLIRVHDPDAEIQDVIRIVDWAEENLDWVARGFDANAGEENIVLGSVGASYGGQFQLLLHAVDPDSRLDAIVPSNTWTDLTTALHTNDVPKSGWLTLLFGAADNQDGDGGNFDPFVTQTAANAFATNRIADDGLEFLRYHSFDYFCDGIPVATNGGAGTTPLQPAAAPLPIPVLLSQGARDTLFTVNDALNNYDCLRAIGSPDVRMISYQSGHNTIFPGPGVTFQSPQPTAADRNCGTLTLDEATLAFFDEHLKGQVGQSNAVIGNPDDICLSLDVNNAITVDRNNFPIGGTEFSFEATPVAAGNSQAVVVADSIFQADADGAVVAGIPTATITLEVPGAGAFVEPDAIVFIGIGHNRASGNGQGVWDTIDNQVIPLRGTGEHSVNLTFVGEVLQPGDRLAVLLYGSYLTHQLSASRDPLAANVMVSGSVNIPVTP